MVFIVGVDHIVQHNGHMNPEKSRAIEEFELHLRDQVGSRAARLLAEEFSEEALHRSNATTSTVGDVSRRMGVDHLYCDPGSDQRIELGIETPHQRELYWLQLLRPYLDLPIIFVCGDDHVPTFSRLLSIEGVGVQTVSTGWGRSLNPDRA